MVRRGSVTKTGSNHRGLIGRYAGNKTVNHLAIRTVVWTPSDPGSGSAAQLGHSLRSLAQLTSLQSSCRQ
jgi:hypothetical protein